MAEQEKQQITVEDLEFYLKDKQTDKNILIAQKEKAMLQVDLIEKSIKQTEKDIKQIEETLKTVKNANQTE